MIQPVIAFLGISGSGKTTFLRGLTGQLQFQHLTAGTLIAKARDAGQDELRLLDIKANQRLLLAGFASDRDPLALLVILDGHAIIDGDAGLAAIGHDVFAKLGVVAIAHFEADPVQISVNRAKDTTRARPQLSVPTLAAHQDYSRKVASETASMLSVRVACFSSTDQQAFFDFLLV